MKDITYFIHLSLAKFLSLLSIFGFMVPLKLRICSNSLLSLVRDAFYLYGAPAASLQTPPFPVFSIPFEIDINGP